MPHDHDDEHDDEADEPAEPASEDEAHDPDGLEGFTTPMSRLAAHARSWLALAVAIAVVLPLGAWLFDEFAFRSSGTSVEQELGPDAELLEAVLLVRTTSCSGVRSSGTAFVVDLGDGPVVVTNRHVVEDAAVAAVRPLQGGPVINTTGQRLSSVADVAVLEVDDPEVFPRVLPAGVDAAVGDEVRLVGFPASRPATAVGPVSATLPGRMVIEIPTNPGASGSPVVDADGRVVGQVHARTLDGDGVATPISTLRSAVAGAVLAPGC